MTVKRKLSIVYSKACGSTMQTVESEIPISPSTLALLAHLPGIDDELFATERPLGEIASILSMIDWDAIGGIDIEHAIQVAVEELDE